MTHYTSLSSAQVEKLPTADAFQVVVERHHGLTEDFTEDVSALSNIVHVVARHADGTVFADTITHNLRTCGGLDWQTNSMSATSGRPTGRLIEPRTEWGAEVIELGFRST